MADISTQAQSLDGGLVERIARAIAAEQGYDWSRLSETAEGRHIQGHFLRSAAAVIPVITAENAAQAAEIASAGRNVYRLQQDNALLSARLNWLANQTMYCDYGDNDHGAVAWHFHTHSGVKVSIIGGSIDEAIDAARALTGGQHG